METINYVLFKNPLVTGVTEYTKLAVNTTMSTFSKSSPSTVQKPVAAALPVSTLLAKGHPLIRVAGFFGASAVILGAYGAHAIYPKDSGDELKKIFETANRYHFIHTLALLGVPFCRWSKTSGVLMVVGMSVFCGTCYYHALTGDSQLRQFTPVGGTFLILGWLAMML